MLYYGFTSISFHKKLVFLAHMSDMNMLLRFYDSKVYVKYVKEAKAPIYPLSAQRRLWSDMTYAQIDLLCRMIRLASNHYVNVSVHIKSSQKTSVFTLLIISFP